MNLDVNIRSGYGKTSAHYQFQTSEHVTGIFGPSGSGKTTLFRLLAGLVEPISGYIKLNDQYLYSSDQRINLPAYRRRVGLMFQESRLFPHWHVEKNLRAGMLKTDHKQPRRFTFMDVVIRLGLEPLLKRSTNEISGGEQRRVALGRVLLSSPALLLMDEPLTGLEDSLKKQILPYLADVYEKFGIPSLYVSHDIREIQFMTDYLVLIEHLQTVAQGRIPELLQDEKSCACLIGTDYVNTLSGYIEGYDSLQGVYEVHAGTCSVWAAMQDPPEQGMPVTLNVSPREISLASRPVEHISIQNQWPGIVKEMIPLRCSVVCMVETACGVLMVEVTKKAESHMGLQLGERVICLIKATAFQQAGQSKHEKGKA